MDWTCRVALACGTVSAVCAYLVGLHLTHARWCGWMSKGWGELSERAKERPLNQDDIVAVFGVRSSPARSASPRLIDRGGNV